MGVGVLVGEVLGRGGVMVGNEGMKGVRLVVKVWRWGGKVCR